MTVNVFGAGLAGCEAAYQLAKRGVFVKLYDMKPNKKTPAHTSGKFAELVCSNSLKAKRIESAAGLLKEEMRYLDSLLVKCADECSVPAGGALAVDREKFSSLVTNKLLSFDNIEFISEEVTEIPEDGISIVATGPLTSDVLSQHITSKFGEHLSFYDAAAPIVSAQSIDMDHAFFESRYQKGDGDDYLNCPLNKCEYEVFYNELVNAERAPVHDFDVRDPKVYEGCMPIEVLAQRGVDTIRFGPMKPVGLRDPKTGHRPWAVLQLRKETKNGDMYNLVGFQTNLKFDEQKRVFGLIPALKNAEYHRYGVMHRNTFINSPKLLGADFVLKSNNNILFAGQITGVEGYMESASSGLIAGINAYLIATGNKPVVMPEVTMIGSLSRYISDDSIVDFQPMGANFGVLPDLVDRPRDKFERGAAYAKRALDSLSEFIDDKKI